MGTIEGLSEAAEEAAMSAVIEDYFFVNEEEIEIAAMTEVALIPEFCITGPSVFKFELAVNPFNEVAMFVVMLLINDEVVAKAQANDMESPSNLALIYRGAIDEQSDVKVIAMSEVAEVISFEGLQVGYKLYGPGYTLIDAPDTSCL